MSKPTRVDYCQYLLSTPLNYTLTHFADHSESFSHDQINRYLAKDRLTPKQVWEHVKSDVIQTCEGYIIFDDTTVEKTSASVIRLAKPQYSGSAQKIVNGNLGIVTCVYVNPELDRSWLIDYRIYDKQGDGKTKLDHVEDMLSVLVRVRIEVFERSTAPAKTFCDEIRLLSHTRRRVESTKEIPLHSPTFRR